MLDSYEDTDDISDSELYCDESDELHNIQELPPPGICECGGEFIDSSEGFRCNLCDTMAPYSVDEYISMVQKKREGLGQQQRRLLHNRLKVLNYMAKARGIEQLSESIIETALDYFANLREVTEETRRQKMMSRIGGCIYYACIKHGSAKTPNDIRRFCKLNCNINKAIELITTMEKSGKKIIDLSQLDDTRSSHVNGLISKLRNIKPDVKELCNEEVITRIINIAIYIFDTAEENLIRISCKYDTKVAACTYIGIRMVIPPSSQKQLSKYLITLDDVGQASNIHANTISHYVDEIKLNISMFPLLSSM